MPFTTIAPAVSARRSPESAASELVLPVARDTGDPDDLAGADAKVDAGEIGAERVFGGEREIAHLEPSVAARARGAVLRMGKVVADHQPRELDAALSARVAKAGHFARAQHRRAVAQRSNLVELVADVENRAAFIGQTSQRGEQLGDGCGVSTDVGSSMISNSGDCRRQRTISTR